MFPFLDDLAPPDPVVMSNRSSLLYQQMEHNTIIKWADYSQNSLRGRTTRKIPRWMNMPLICTSWVSHRKWPQTAASVTKSRDTARLRQQVGERAQEAGRDIDMSLTPSWCHFCECDCRNLLESGCERGGCRRGGRRGCRAK